MRETLQLLGLRDDDAIRAAGIRLFQLLMPVPLEPAQVREFAHGLAEVIVVEEKNPTLERLVRDALYDSQRASDGRRPARRPGPAADPRRRDARRRATDRAAAGSARGPPRRPPRAAARRRSAAGRSSPLSVERAPFFCSGCPHNTSTRVAPGTLVGGGIGCHAMVGLMEAERVGDLVGLTCMGNEGAQWIGMAPFLERKHLVQNLGDGTFFHSGSLAIRAAVAAGVDITYKLLHNGTVAMTGGQDAVGAVGVPEIAKMVLLEGVSKVIVTTDDLDRYDADEFPEGVDVWHRTRLDEAQKVLAAIPGTTVLIHDQACAAENRRARSRGKLATPDFRVVINERVCEGCGDCGAKSNCLSVQPVDTPYGRKTRIDQTSCNFDFSCMEGDCPAFATVSTDPAGQKRTGTSTGEVDVSDLPEPTPIVDPARFTVRLSGIGGTGVVTVSQILGTAAMLAGHTVRGLDQTGLSQKAGPVTSDIRITDEPSSSSNHASVSGVDAAARVRPAGRRQRLAPPRRHARSHRRHRQHPRRPDRRDGLPPHHRVPGLRLAARAARSGVAAAS